MKSIDELVALKEKVKAELSVRDKNYFARIEIAMSTCGIAAGARDVLLAVLDELKIQNLNNVQVCQTVCEGNCSQEPVIKVLKNNQPKFVYGNVTPQRVKNIITAHVMEDQPIKEWLIN
ncbi:MAG: (2Fe-2S) ferredoxin domain-containing protein [Bacillota bacterium]